MKQITKYVAFVLIFSLLVASVQPVGANAKRTTSTSTMNDFQVVGTTDCKAQWIHVESKKPCIIRLGSYWGETLWVSDWDNQNLRLRWSWKKGFYYSRDYWCGSDVYWVWAKSISGEYTMVDISYGVD